MPKISKTDEQWQRELTPEQYRVTRARGTEPPFSGTYWNTDEPGVYRCVCCGAPLFGAEHKFDAGCGWPSFSAPLAAAEIDEAEDTSHGMRRTEVACGKCGAHLGHVFLDGPPPTRLRYCINSVALKLQKQ